jgi:hypothetical protein
MLTRAGVDAINRGIDAVLDQQTARHLVALAEIERLQALLRQTLPMVDALDATKTAVVWTAALQMDAAILAREIRSALGPNVGAKAPT